MWPTQIERWSVGRGGFGLVATCAVQAIINVFAKASRPFYHLVKIKDGYSLNRNPTGASAMTLTTSRSLNLITGRQVLAGSAAVRQLWQCPGFLTKAVPEGRCALPRDLHRCRSSGSGVEPHFTGGQMRPQ